jgi:hypothetical protein
MRTALLIFGDWHEKVEISEHIYNLYEERERLCSISLNKFKEKLNSVPGDAILIEHPEIFEDEEEYYEDDELDEILDGYFYKKGVECFGFREEEIILEGYLAEGDEDIRICFKPLKFSL